MESEPRIDTHKVEERFSVLYLSLRSSSTRTFLHVDLDVSPKKNLRVIPKKHIDNLVDFAEWLFGTDDLDPIISDSRDVDRFGEVLKSDEAVDYLRRTKRPSFDRAYRMAGGSELEAARHLEVASDQLEDALRTLHLHKKSNRIKTAVYRVFAHVQQIRSLFKAEWSESSVDK